MDGRSSASNLHAKILVSVVRVKECAIGSIKSPTLSLLGGRGHVARKCSDVPILISWSTVMHWIFVIFTKVHGYEMSKLFLKVWWRSFPNFICYRISYDCPKMCCRMHALFELNLATNLSHSHSIYYLRNFRLLALGGRMGNVSDNVTTLKSHTRQPMSSVIFQEFLLTLNIFVYFC
jgi:hypothetical protein